MPVVGGVDFLIAVNDTTFRVLLSGGDGGDTFKLTFDGQTTAAIVETDSTAQITAKLEALTNIAVGDVSVSGAAADWLIRFIGDYSGLAVPVLTSSEETDALVVEINEQRYNLSLSDTLTPGATYTTPLGQCLVVDGDVGYAISSDAEELLTLDLSDPANVAVLDNITSVNMTSPQGLVVDDDVAYVSGTTSDKITIFDVSDPTAIAELGDFTNANMDGPQEMAIDGLTLYVANLDANTLQSLDVTNPAVVVELDSIGTALDAPRALVKLGDYVYILNTGDNNMIIFDVSTPAAIIHVKTVAMGGVVDRLVASPAGYLFISFGTSDAFQAWDVTDRENPRLVDSFAGSEIDEPQGMSLQGSLLYVCQDDNQILLVLDVSMPSNMRIVGSVDIGSTGARWVSEVANGHVFIAERTGSAIKAVDISNLQTVRNIIGCQRGGQLSMDVAQADATNKDSNNWAESEQIIRSWSITFDSLSPEDDAGMSALQRAYAQNMPVFVITSTPSNKFYSGIATLANVTRDGPHDNLYTFAGAVNGTGALTLNVAPTGLITGDDSDFAAIGEWLSTNATLTATYDSTDAGHDETLRIEADTGATNYAKLDLDVLSGQRYKLQLDYKHINVDGFVNNFSTVEIEDHGVLTGGLPVKTSGWQEDFLLRFTSSVSGTKELRIYCTDGADGDAANELLIDNITLQPV